MGGVSLFIQHVYYDMFSLFPVLRFICNIYGPVPSVNPSVFPNVMLLYKTSFDVSQDFLSGQGLTIHWRTHMPH